MTRDQDPERLTAGGMGGAERRAPSVLDVDSLFDYESSDDSGTRPLPTRSGDVATSDLTRSLALGKKSSGRNARSIQSRAALSPHWWATTRHQLPAEERARLESRQVIGKKRRPGRVSGSHLGPKPRAL